MAIHRDLTPDFRESVARTALKALHAANSRETAGNGTVSVRNADGTTTVIGAGAGVDETGAPKGIDSFRGDTVPPGMPLGVTFSSVSCDATAYWDGRLEGGVPADFDRVEFYAKNGEKTSTMGCLTEAGSLSMLFEAGDRLACWAVAFDVQGNVSVKSPNAVLNVVDVPSQAQAAADEAKEMASAASADISKQAEEVRKADAKADAAATDASSAKSTASTASTNASSALSKSTTLETLIRQSGDGVEVAKKVDGRYTSTKTLTDETGFSILSSTGTVLSKFSDRKIELGKNSAGAVIELCNGYGVISGTSGGGVRLDSKPTDGFSGSVNVGASGTGIGGNYGGGEHYANVYADAGAMEGYVLIGGDKLYVNPPRKSDGTSQSSGISMVGFANMIVDSGWKMVWSDTNHTVRIRRVGCCVTLFIYADAGSFGTDWKKWTKVPDEFKPSFDVYAAVAAGANTGSNNVMLADVSADGYVYIKTMGGTCTGVRGQVTWFLDYDG